MKLQIEGQKLRVRIDEDELGRLLAGDPVEAQTHFSDVFAIRFTVQTATGNQAGFDGEASHWLITLPIADLHAHAARLPTRDGLRYALASNNSAEILELLFDVDVRDSVSRRRGR